MSGLDEKARQLRHAFDRAFAEPLDGTVVTYESLLCIRIDGHPFALRLREIVGLVTDKVITAAPSSARELLGLAGFRGDVVPVYDLPLLLGHPPSPSPRYLALVMNASQKTLALAFDVFEGHARVLLESIASDDVVRIDGAVRPIIHTKPLLAAISERATREHRHVDIR